MRLTTVLLKESYRWRLKQMWKTKGVFPPLTTRMPTFVKDRVDVGKINVKTAADLLTVERKFPSWEPSVKDDPQTSPPRTEKDHRDYHEDWVYEFASKTRLMEGEKQALILTNAQPFYEIPKKVAALVGATSLPDQDLLMQRAIMQSNVWDPSKDKLPRRFSTRLPGWRFKAEFGIRNSRIASTMIRNAVQLCEMAHPELLDDRRTIFDPFLYSFFFHDGKHVAVTAENDLLLCARKAVPPFADENEVDASTAYKFPEIFPLAPTIDLRRQHVWRADVMPGWRVGFSHPHALALFAPYDDRWTTTERNARGLMYCYAQASAAAKRVYGFDATHLPSPVSTQCVMTNGVDFSFVWFQLNTLATGGSGGGVKNLVWFDADNAMYRKILPQRAMLRNTKYEDYDPEVLKKLMAVYAYGGK